MKRSLSILLTCLSIIAGLSGCYMSRYSKSGELDMSDPSYTELMPFGKGFEKALYKADLEVNGHEFSGLMMIKASGGGNYKVAFFNELGLNFFDFELRHMGGKKELNLYVRNIYSPLDKDILLNKFEKYFNMLLGQGPTEGIQKTYLKNEGIGILILKDSYKGKDGFISTNLLEPYTEIINVGGLWKKEKISMQLSPETINYSPQNILIEHPGFRLKFKLDLVD